MTQYEVLIEIINPCGGEHHAEKQLIEVETDDPEAYVRSDSPFPIRGTSRNPQGDLTITTGNDQGYQKKYTFSE